MIGIFEFGDFLIRILYLGLYLWEFSSFRGDLEFEIIFMRISCVSMRIKLLDLLVILFFESLNLERAVGEILMNRLFLYF